jgi:hypothetical protein
MVEDVKRSYYEFEVADIRDLEIDNDSGGLAKLWFRGWDENGMEVEVQISDINIFDLLLSITRK